MFGASQSGSSGGSGSARVTSMIAAPRWPRSSASISAASSTSEPPRHVAEHRARFHRGERGCIEHVLGVGRGGRAQHDGIATRQDLVERGGAEQLVGEGRRRARLVAATDAQGHGAERPSAYGDRPADRAESHEADSRRVEQSPERGTPCMFPLQRVEIGEPLPHAEQPRDDELGDRHRCDTHRVRDHDGVGEAGVVEVVDPRADRLYPAQVRCQLLHALREVEGHHDLGAIPHGAAVVGELVEAVLVANVLTELADVRHRRAPRRRARSLGVGRGGPRVPPTGTTRPRFRSPARSATGVRIWSAGLARRGPMSPCVVSP